MDINKLFVERLKNTISEKGISQIELAKVARISNAYVSQLLRGKKNPTIKVVKQIADALGLPVSYFLESEKSIGLYLSINKNLTSDDIKAIDAFTDFLVKRRK